jgi:hypothetical protein
MVDSRAREPAHQSPAADGGGRTRPTRPPSRLAALGRGTLNRLYAFRVTYVAIFLFLLLYVFSVKGAERLLQTHFARVVEEAVQISDFTIPVTMQIQSRIDRRVMQSRWIRWAGVRATTIVLAADGQTWLYVGGRTVQPPASLDPRQIALEAARLVPANEEVIVSVPHNTLLANGILAFYAGLLLSGLFFFNRAVARREARRLTAAISARDLTQLRTESIERELETVRERLLNVLPMEREHAEEISVLQRERESLQAKLGSLAQREEELRLKAARAVELEEERQALEELLEEAGSDLASKDDEIRELGQSLKRAARAENKATGRAREGEQLKRRLETLYKTLEIDARAISDLIALRDETMKLKAEQSLKRLADESENIAVRRKVGGLPPHLAIFELGFAGKGRVYYMRGKQRRFRVLTLGAKNTQNADLEYLRKLAP